MTAEDVQLFYELAQSARPQVTQASDPRAAFEMLSLRLLAFRPVTVLDPHLSADDLIDASPSAPEADNGVKKPEPPPAAAVSQPTKPQAPPAADTSVVEAPGPSSLEGQAPWYETLAALQLSGSALNIASHCVVESVVEGPEGASWQLRLDESRANLFNERHIAMVAKALSDWRQAPCEVSITPGPVREETPAMRRLRLEAERQEVAVAEINDDPRIKSLVQEFDATVLRDSVTVDQP
ncbi:DNA polymerase III, gamma/tau subunit [Congregibacter litoralis KT71]|uniref:DNA polymerase III, gamma/tau subunit n=1 Tax=Congregibacter litoralis KT71 TaxID=314285 RepID=V7HV53_9GAMM|nr:DNA polymerase III, gamma/tau subunit [Congregibacter litoralis KT71]